MRIYLHSFFFWEANIFTFSFLQFRANMERVFFVLWPSQPICSSDLLHFRNSFSVGHSRYECYYYYSYPMKKSWKMGRYCCGWDGVTCDTMTGHVIGLDLSCSGKSPTTISKGKFQSHLESLSHWRGLIFHTIILWLGLSCVIKWKTEMAC